MDATKYVSISMPAIAPNFRVSRRGWEGFTKAVKQVETVQRTASNKTLACSGDEQHSVKSRTTNNDSLKQEETRGTRMAIYSKYNDGRTIASHRVDKGTRWDKEAEKTWNEIRGDHKKALATEEFVGYESELNEG